MNFEEDLIMFWLYSDFIDYDTGYIRTNKEYLKSLYDELLQLQDEDDHRRAETIKKMISIIERWNLK